MPYPISHYKNYSITSEPIICSNNISALNIGPCVLKQQGFGFIALNGDNTPGTAGDYVDRLDPSIYPENLPFYDCVLPELPTIGANLETCIKYRFGLALYWTGKIESGSSALRVSGAYFYLSSVRGLILGVDNKGNAGLYFWQPTTHVLVSINTFKLSDQFSNGQVNLILDYECYYDSTLSYNIFKAVLKVQYNGDVATLSAVYTSPEWPPGNNFAFLQPLLMPLADLSLLLASFTARINEVSTTVEAWENVNIIPGKNLTPFKLQITDGTKFVSGSFPSYKYDLLFFNARKVIVNNWVELDGDLYYPSQIVVDNRKNNYTLIVEIAGLSSTVRPGDMINLQTPKHLLEMSFTCLQWGFAELILTGLESKADYKTF